MISFRRGRSQTKFQPKINDAAEYLIYASISLLPLVAFNVAHAAIPMPPVPASSLVEVTVGDVFFPEKGYGSNNLVQLTLDGYLPNRCYQIAKPKYELLKDSKTIIVHQYAYLEQSELCQDQARLPLQFRGIVPFTHDLSIGHLPAGDYKVVFNPKASRPQSKPLNVYLSKNMTTDDLAYASVSTVSMPKIVNGEAPIKVQLNGVFNSSCSFISDLKVTIEKDVVVVQPILGYKPEAFCVYTLIPFSQEFEIGKHSEGRYLMHVRSMSGEALNHVFSVMTPDPALK